jgi:hypothetical protein
MFSADKGTAQIVSHIYPLEDMSVYVPSYIGGYAHTLVGQIFELGNKSRLFFFFLSITVGVMSNDINMTVLLIHACASVL